MRISKINLILSCAWLSLFFSHAMAGPFPEALTSEENAAPTETDALRANGIAAEAPAAQGNGSDLLSNALGSLGLGNAAGSGSGTPATGAAGASGNALATAAAQAISQATGIMSLGAAQTPGQICQSSNPADRAVCKPLEVANAAFLKMFRSNSVSNLPACRAMFDRGFMVNDLASLSQCGSAIANDTSSSNGINVFGLFRAPISVKGHPIFKAAAAGVASQLRANNSLCQHPTTSGSFKAFYGALGIPVCTQ